VGVEHHVFELDLMGRDADLWLLVQMGILLRGAAVAVCFNSKETQQNILHIQAMVDISRDPQKMELNEESGRG
jgi:hypothetical protein